MEFVKRWAISVANMILLMVLAATAVAIFLIAISSPIAFAVCFAGCILLIGALDALEAKQ